MLIDKKVTWSKVVGEFTVVEEVLLHKLTLAKIVEFNDEGDGISEWYVPIADLERVPDPDEPTVKDIAWERLVKAYEMYLAHDADEVKVIKEMKADVAKRDHSGSSEI